MRREDLIHKDLCFNIMGALFSVYRDLGGSLLEKHYQKAVAQAFRKLDYKFSEQVLVKHEYEGAVIGVFYVDFIIEINNVRIVLEIKKHENFGQKNIQQVYNYLRALNLELGILANFTRQGVRFKRIVNLKQ